MNWKISELKYKRHDKDLIVITISPCSLVTSQMMDDHAVSCMM